MLLRIVARILPFVLAQISGEAGALTHLWVGYLSSPEMHSPSFIQNIQISPFKLIIYTRAFRRLYLYLNLLRYTLYLYLYLYLIPYTLHLIPYTLYLIPYALDLYLYFILYTIYFCVETVLKCAGANTHFCVSL